MTLPRSWKVFFRRQTISETKRKHFSQTFLRTTPKLSFADWNKYLEEISSTKKVDVNSIKMKLVECGEPGVSGATVCMKHYINSIVEHWKLDISQIIKKKSLKLHSLGCSIESTSRLIQLMSGDFDISWTWFFYDGVQPTLIEQVPFSLYFGL